MMEQCKTYNSFMKIKTASITRDIIATVHRVNGLICNPIERVTFYFKEDDYIASRDVDGE